MHWVFSLLTELTLFLWVLSEKKRKATINLSNSFLHYNINNYNWGQWREELYHPNHWCSSLNTLQQLDLELELGHRILCKKKQKPKTPAKAWRREKGDRNKIRLLLLIFSLLNFIRDTYWELFYPLPFFFPSDHNMLSTLRQANKRRQCFFCLNNTEICLKAFPTLFWASASHLSFT